MVEDLVARGILGKQQLDSATQLFIILASFSEKRPAPLWIALASRVVQFLNSPPTFGSHWPPRTYLHY